MEPIVNPAPAEIGPWVRPEQAFLALEVGRYQGDVPATWASDCRNSAALVNGLL